MQSEKNDTEYFLDLFDETASVCELDEEGKPQFAIKVLAKGVVVGNILKAETTQATCLSNPPVSFEPGFEIAYTYRTSSDTLLGTDELVWIRQ